MSSPKLQLPEVTLIAATSVAGAATARAMVACLDQVDFGAVRWCSDSPPPVSLQPFAEWHPIVPLVGRGAYSRFVLGELHQFVSTSHALVVQWDGFVVNAGAWDQRFLDYDYVGAPWPHFADELTVGNGGFSLRSRRLLEATVTLREADEAEDVAICRTWRRHLESRFGLSFAPEALAARFSYERAIPPHPTFGFHGAFNLVRHLPAAEAEQILALLEPSLLAANEINELLIEAVKRLDFRLAAVMVRRKWARRRQGTQVARSP